MLKAVSTRGVTSSSGHFAIVASRYNARFVDSMMKSARQHLRQAGAQEVEVVRVPGAFEIPLAVAILARRRWPRLSGIIALGVILRGETTHAEHIGVAVTDGLLRIQLESEIPVIHEVLLLENVEQAQARCLNARFNRGHEAAQAALEMERVVRRFFGRGKGREKG
jgi:6,7-dimethyl-8-ribityllumazine synthase